MNCEELRERIRTWDLQIEKPEDGIADSKYGRMLHRLEFYAQNEWKSYLPTEHSEYSRNYLDRLAEWIGNVGDEQDQKLLLEYALHISFFSYDDFVALYRTAFRRDISRWIACQESGTVERAGFRAFSEQVQNELHKTTWYCPVTDSMKINDFCHVNHLGGVSEHPCFSTLHEFAKTDREANSGMIDIARKYIARKNLRRIVLLEDFVGSGNQCCASVFWAAENLGIPVLFVPLFVCPKGLRRFREQEATRVTPKLTIAPIIQLTADDSLGSERGGADGWSISRDVEELANRCHPMVSAGQEAMEVFGFLNTGCSLVLNTNTPNNSLPMIHNRPATGSWSPIFPRVDRVPI
jgi:hypothetical protein